MDSGIQRYICSSCGRSFRESRRPKKLRALLWNEFVFNRATVKQLAKKYSRSVHWIRKELRAYEPPPVELVPCEIVAVMDCVFFRRSSGYLVVRDPHRTRNVYWSEVASETLDEYRCARDTLASLGFVIKAVVADGKPGLKRLYEDIPVQMCHFHQKAIITRYLTTKPRLEAGVELRELTHSLCDAKEDAFIQGLVKWYEKWRTFLLEKTTNPETRKWNYTHKRLRAAYRSLKTNLPYLFSYQRYPELGIPNTTNGLEGSFTHLKELVKLHRGIKPDLKKKMAETILRK